MREIPKPVIDTSEPLDEAMARIERYGKAVIKANAELIARMPIGRNAMEYPKVLTNTGHDKALRATNTIHDRMADNPAMLAELKRIFG